MKIIFLDIDGVILTGNCHMLDVNDLMAKSFFADLDGKSSTDRRDAKIKYSLNAKFNEYAIMLINRLAEKTGAKIVIHSNWRRSVGHKDTKKKLIEQGVKEDYFHESYYCSLKMTSCKLSDITSWLHKHRLTEHPKIPSMGDYTGINYHDIKDDPIKYKAYADSIEKHKNEMSDFHKKSNNYGIEYVIIDDDHLDFDYQVSTDFNEGFTLEEYRIACGMLGAEDSRLDVNILSNSEFNKVKKHFYRKGDLYNWLYSKRDNKGYIVPRASLLSFAQAEKALNTNRNCGMLLGMENENVDELYKKRSDDVWLELKSKYHIIRKHPMIIDSWSSLEENSGVKLNNFENTPKDFPCVFIGTKEKPEYLYAPENITNKEEFLYGYLIGSGR